MILFQNQCGFHKAFNSKHCLLAMLGNLKETVDNGKEGTTNRSFQSI